MIWEQNVLHVCSLDRYTPPTIREPPTEPQPTIIKYCDEWLVNQILDYKPLHGTLHYLIQ